MMGTGERKPMFGQENHRRAMSALASGVHMGAYVGVVCRGASGRGDRWRRPAGMVEARAPSAGVDTRGRRMGPFSGRGACGRLLR